MNVQRGVEGVGQGVGQGNVQGQGDIRIDLEGMSQEVDCNTVLSCIKLLSLMGGSEQYGFKIRSVALQVAEKLEEGLIEKCRVKAEEISKGKEGKSEEEDSGKEGKEGSKYLKGLDPTTKLFNGGRK